MKKIVCIFIMMLLIATSSITLADWDPEDGHKMHYPQLPDPNGWDIYSTAGLAQYPWVSIADDWQCSETGYIKDIHFWGSWFGDIVGEIDHFVIGIAANIPPEQNPNGAWSCPGETFIEWGIYDWIERGPYEGNQGWYWSYDEDNPWYPNDHHLYWQYNVFLDEEDWFWQEEGVIYWLFISAIVEENPREQPLWGWKSTTEDLHFMDDAVWGYWGELYWLPLYYPTGMTMDLAFVITGGEHVCNPSINVKKYVKHPESGEWIDAPTENDALDIKIGSTVEFKITMENDGEPPLTLLEVEDTMEYSLLFISAEPPPDTHGMKWEDLGDIQPGETKEIIIQAKLVGEHCHTYYQKVTVTAACACDEPDCDCPPQIKEYYAYVHAVSGIPDLSCEGSLSWTDVKPDTVVTGSFNVKNIGDPGSELAWKVDDYPTWGSWTFSESNGGNLKPEDGLYTISVTVTAPSEEEETFSGNVKLVNEMDSSDTCTIPVSLVTPKSKSFVNLMFFRFLENHPNIYQLLHQLLELDLLQ